MSNLVSFNSIDSIGSENSIYNKPFEETFFMKPVNGFLTLTFSFYAFSFFFYICLNIAKGS